jgi:hypothetical protein
MPGQHIIQGLQFGQCHPNPWWHLLNSI